ncbi:MAG: thiamine pyrophosphate-binding protein [Acidimicrobiales bacterium]
MVLIGTDAFQECDTVGITRSVTKHNELVTRAEDIPNGHPAFYIATTGRPGPVLVDIPKDIVDPMNPRSYGTGPPTPRWPTACLATSRPPRAIR